MASIFNPGELLDKIGVAAGISAADLGCGSGHFVLELCQRVGQSGKVYAVDVMPSSLEATRSLVKLRGWANLETRWANLEKTSSLSADSCDLVVVSNLLFQMDKKFYPNLAKEVDKILRRGGRLLLIDWQLDSVLGPAKNDRVSEQQGIEIFSCFGKPEKIGAGESHWALLFSKK